MTNGAVAANDFGFFNRFMIELEAYLAAVALSVERLKIFRFTHVV